jgi:hypothetical protein
MLSFLAAVADDPTDSGVSDVAGPLERLARSTGYLGDEQATLRRVGAVAFGSALRGIEYDHDDDPSLPAGVERAARVARKVVCELRRRAYRAGRRSPMLEIVNTARLERLLRRDPRMLAPPERRALFTVATWILATPPETHRNHVLSRSFGVG